MSSDLAPRLYCRTCTIRRLNMHHLQPEVPPWLYHRRSFQRSLAASSMRLPRQRMTTILQWSFATKQSRHLRGVVLWSSLTRGIWCGNFLFLVRWLPAIGRVLFSSAGIVIYVCDALFARPSFLRVPPLRVPPFCAYSIMVLGPQHRNIRSFHGGETAIAPCRRMSYWIVGKPRLCKEGTAR